MNPKEIETQILNPLFDSKFDRNNFYNFLNEIFPDFKFDYNEKNVHFNNEYNDFVEYVYYCGSYESNETIHFNTLPVYIIKLKKTNSLNRSKTMQRNLMAWLLKKIGSNSGLAVFYDDFSDEWRISFIKRETSLIRDKNNNLKTQTTLSSAKRHSFLVGNERNHTCKSRFLNLITKNITPTLSDIEEVFNVETVTDEFFEEYKKLYVKLKKNLDDILKKSKNSEDKSIYNDFTQNNLKTSDFAKKLMGQIVFIYFLQKKGWLGVKENQQWGEGDKDFFKRLFNKEYYNWETVEESNSFFNNCLEPLFYKGFSHSSPNYYMNEFGFKVPFLNGGLFSPITNYDWLGTVIEPDNKIFEEIIKVFDEFNFTVCEDDPLEKEVAVDPEMLGKVFEKLLGEEERGKNGAFYTPRNVVHYMCKKSLIHYLNTNSDVDLEDISNFVENSTSYLDRIIRFPEDLKGNAISEILKGKRINRIKLPKSIYSNIDVLDDLLSKVKVADPAVGSGAFPVAMMNEIVNTRYILQTLQGNPFIDIYSLKKETIKNSLYCVDLDYSATDITKLRFWLSLIVDSDVVEQLPNLENNVICGNSLVDTYNSIKLFNNSHAVFDKDDKNQQTLDTNSSYFIWKRIINLKEQYFNEKIEENKKEEKEELDNLKWDFIEESYVANGGNKEDIVKFKNLNFKPFLVWEIEFLEIFSKKDGGFDIIIGNPPYVSNKKIKKNDLVIKKIYEDIYGIKDDLYNYFFLKSFNLLKERGILSFITSNTYFTLNSKINLRNLFQSNKIIELMDVANVFKDPEVEPAIMIVKKEKSVDDYDFIFIDAKKSFDLKTFFNINTSLYKNSPGNVFFQPSTFNLEIYNKFLSETKQLMEIYWEKIKDSKMIVKNKKELDIYRNNLNAGDLTILGLIIEGGQGLATANNGKFVGILEKTSMAKNTIESRPKKFFSAVKKYNIVEYDYIKSENDAKNFIANKTESEIRLIFDDLKMKYGNNIFGQGYLFRIISKKEIVDLDNISENEKNNGFVGKSTFVPYDKGDKKGNRWYLNTPYYIDWSRKNVQFLRTSSKARFQNSQFYFKEGLCWNNVLNPHSKFIKCRLKSVSIHDVASMSFFPIMDIFSSKFIVCLINSTFLFNYERTFINNTVNLQINDFKQFPIIVPTKKQLSIFENIFDEAYDTKIQYFNGEISEEEHDNKLIEIQFKLDKNVYDLYNILVETDNNDS